MKSESLEDVVDRHTRPGETWKSIQRKKKNQRHLECKDLWQGTKKEGEMRQREEGPNSYTRWVLRSRTARKHSGLKLDPGKQEEAD